MALAFCNKSFSQASAKKITINRQTPFTTRSSIPSFTHFFLYFPSEKE
jgi:hypothetical protein